MGGSPVTLPAGDGPFLPVARVREIVGWSGDSVNGVQVVYDVEGDVVRGPKRMGDHGLYRQSKLVLDVQGGEVKAHIVDFFFRWERLFRASRCGKRTDVCFANHSSRCGKRTSCPKKRYIYISICMHSSSNKSATLFGSPRESSEATQKCIILMHGTRKLPRLLRWTTQPRRQCSSSPLWGLPCVIIIHPSELF